MERYEINKFIESYQKSLNDMILAMDLDNVQKEINELDQKMLSEDFWNDRKEAQRIISRLNYLKDNLTEVNNLKREFDDLLALDEMVLEGMDEAIPDLELAITNFQHHYDDFEVLILLSGEYDNCNAILELHPGAGGTESMDWALMLYRMYTRYAALKGFKVEVLDYLPGEEAGIKSVTISIKGKNAYGYLKAESGVHRLVRISPFDSNARRHTSFCSCEVVPEIDNSIDIEINEEDIKIDVYRSSGAGGQSVNTTDSAVRITHKPTGIVVTCQNERSQIKNREKAMMILKSKLISLELRKKEEEMARLKGEQKEIGWGSQIRSYVMHPYSMVKDHRTNYETGNVNQVLDGYLDDFINQYLKKEVSL